MVVEVEEVEAEKETIIETKMVVEDEAEVKAEKPEEAVAVLEVAEVEEDMKHREEKALQAHSRELFLTDIILLMNMLPSRPKICSNCFK